MFLNFIGRGIEQSDLKKRYDSDEFEFIVIYGRRRIGKTTLIKKFLEGRDGFYFLCDKSGTVRNAARFKQKAARFLDEPPIESNDLYDIFENLTRKYEKRAVIVLDEFSYLVEKDDSIPSIFQNIIDETLVHSKFMLILCGSSLSMMERGVLSYKSPLYGRKTGHIRLGELSFSDMPEFYQGNTLIENVKFHSVVGGVPHYLEKFSDSRDIYENVREEILSKTGRLYEEVEFLLREEFREPDIYKTILSAIANGCTRVVEIANRASIPANNLPKYLRPLLSLGVIKKEYSVLDTRKKKPRYYIADNMINFWFTFSEPFKSELEVMELDPPVEYLMSNFNTYVGKRFEEMVRVQLLRKIIPFSISRMGRLWYGGTEIDAVAMDNNGNRIAFIEIKFRDKVDAVRLKRALETKVEKLPIARKNVVYFFVAKSFSRKIDGCFTLADLMRSQT